MLHSSAYRVSRCRSLYIDRIIPKFHILLNNLIISEYAFGICVPTVDDANKGGGTRLAPPSQGGEESRVLPITAASLT